MIHFYGYSLMPRVLRDVCRCAGILVLFLIVGCQTTTPPAEIQDERRERFERVLILPVFDMSRFHGMNASVRGPVSGEVFVTDVVAPKADEFFGTAFRSRLMQMENVQIIEPDIDTITSQVGLVPVQGPRDARIAAVQAAGRRRGAHGVICTYVYTFRKRVGTAYGVDAPASVSFESILLNVADGRIVWQESYTETQTPLNDNLLRIDKFLERGGRWITAQEMAERAIDQMMKELAGRF